MSLWKLSGIDEHFSINRVLTTLGILCETPGGDSKTKMQLTEADQEESRQLLVEVHGAEGEGERWKMSPFVSEQRLMLKR
jgi:hypothetical protein